MFIPISWCYFFMLLFHKKGIILNVQGPLDLAVLKICTDRPLPTLSLASATPGKGHPVFAVGHAMLSPQPKGAAMGITSRFGWAPSVSYGNVLQVM